MSGWSPRALFFLTAVSMITALSLLYLERAMGLNGSEKGSWVMISAILVALAIVITAWPAAKLSDRIGPQGGHLCGVRSRRRPGWPC